MLNTCVCCGDIIPEGMQVCYACSHGGLNCPECGAPLSLMCSTRTSTDKQVLYSRLYHCEKCHVDWESEEPASGRTASLYRKFYG